MLTQLFQNVSQVAALPTCLGLNFARNVGFRPLQTSDLRLARVGKLHETTRRRRRPEMAGVDFRRSRGSLKAPLQALDDALQLVLSCRDTSAKAEARKHRAVRARPGIRLWWGWVHCDPGEQMHGLKSVLGKRDRRPQLYNCYSAWPLYVRNGKARRGTSDFSGIPGRLNAVRVLKEQRARH